MRRILYTTLGSLVISACAHTHQGMVAMKISPEEAHIGLGSKDVKVGDEVSLFQTKCERPSKPWQGPSHTEGQPSCAMVASGHGKVVRVLDQNYSIIQVPSGIPLEEGMTVLKD